MNCLREFDPYVLSGTYTGSAAAIYPKMVELDSITFQKPYALVGVQLSSTFRIDTGNLAAFFIVVGASEKVLQVSNSIGCVASQVASVSAIGAVSSEADHAPFGEYGVSIPPGKKISLFASCNAGGVNTITAIACLQLVPIK